MKHRGISAILLMLPLLALAQGCANTYERNHMAANSDARKRLVIAVMPFQGVSESPGSGLIVADVLANELYALGGNVLITPEVIAARAAPREGEVLSPEETGKMVGARYIVTGRVTEYTYKSGVGEQPAVGVTARLIESATGRVLWSATRARTGSAAWFQEDSLGLLTSRICRDLALSLKGSADSYGYGVREDEFTAAAYPAVKDAPKAGTDGKAAEPPAGGARNAPAGSAASAPVARSRVAVPGGRPAAPGNRAGESAVLF